jgi:CD80-like C2-set immunoglobulin domain
VFRVIESCNELSNHGLGGKHVSCWLSSVPTSNSILTIVFPLVSTVKPLTVRILTKQLPLVAEKRYELVCESAGSRPPAVITWYKNKRQLKRVKVGGNIKFLVLESSRI